MFWRNVKKANKWQARKFSADDIRAGALSIVPGVYKDMPWCESGREPSFVDVVNTIARKESLVGFQGYSGRQVAEHIQGVVQALSLIRGDPEAAKLFFGDQGRYNMSQVRALDFLKAAVLRTLYNDPNPWGGTKVFDVRAGYIFQYPADAPLTLSQWPPVVVDSESKGQAVLNAGIREVALDRIAGTGVEVEPLRGPAGGRGISWGPERPPREPDRSS